MVSSPLVWECPHYRKAGEVQGWGSRAELESLQLLYEQNSLTHPPQAMRASCAHAGTLRLRTKLLTVYTALGRPGLSPSTATSAKLHLRPACCSCR